MTHCQGSHAQMVRLFLVFTYILQEDVAKICIVLGARRNVNLARGYKMISKPNQLLHHFSMTIHLHLANLYATKYFY